MLLYPKASPGVKKKMAPAPAPGTNFFLWARRGADWRQGDATHPALEFRPGAG